MNKDAAAAAGSAAAAASAAARAQAARAGADGAVHDGVVLASSDAHKGTPAHAGHPASPSDTPVKHEHEQAGSAGPLSAPPPPPMRRLGPTKRFVYLPTAQIPRMPHGRPQSQDAAPQAASAAAPHVRPPKRKRMPDGAARSPPAPAAPQPGLQPPGGPAVRATETSLLPRAASLPPTPSAPNGSARGSALSESATSAKPPAAPKGARHPAAGGSGRSASGAPTAERTPASGSASTKSVSASAPDAPPLNGSRPESSSSPHLPDPPPDADPASQPPPAGPARTAPLKGDRAKHLSMWTVDTDDVSSTGSAPVLPDDMRSQQPGGRRPDAGAKEPTSPDPGANGRSSRRGPSPLSKPSGASRRPSSAAKQHSARADMDVDADTPQPVPPSRRSSSSSLPPPAQPSLGSAVEVRKKKKAKARKDHRYLSKQALQPAIHAVDVVRKNPKPYAHVGDESNRIGDDIQTIELEYPGHNAQEIFPLVVPSKTTQIEYNPINDIYVTTQMIARHCLSEQQMPLLGDSRSGIVRRIIKACHRKDSVALQSAVSDFNQVVTQLKDEGAFEQDEIRGPPAQYELITHILEQAYARSVAPLAHLLNNYEGFSNNVYGEIKHSFVQDLIKNAEIQPHHIFLDMGSGIGNVILQVSAQCLCESYGIEIMEIPSQLAKKQKAEFLSRMRYYAKPCGRIVVKQGDFLEDPEIHEVISRADVIFVNNYAFDAALNQGILAKFLDLKDSAKVISLRSFVPVDRRPSLRRSNAIESIFTVKEYHYARDSVSWMVEGGKYYIHTVDRSQLADFA